MEELNNQKLIAVEKARLVPPSAQYPDCECLVVLTEEFFYVLEENMGGDFDCHFKIPADSLVSIGRYQEKEHPPAAGRGDTASRTATQLAGYAAMGLLGGVLASAGKKAGSAKTEPFLRVDYRAESGKTQSLFFGECHKMKKVIRAFEKRKKSE